MREIKVAGKRVELKAATGNTIESRPGGWKIITDSTGKRTRFRTARHADQFFIHADGKTTYGSIVEKQRSSDQGGGAAESLAPQYPGKVRKILVKEGEKVAEGDSLILLEAMKMEFAIKAPTAGIVKKWKIKEGENFSPGANLLDFEESKK